MKPGASTFASHGSAERVRSTGLEWLRRLLHPFIPFPLRVILFVALVGFSAVPVLVLDNWVERSAIAKEVAAVSEKHLLIARNLSTALSRYVIDVKAGFRVAAGHANTRANVAHLESLMRALGFRHACIIDSGNLTNAFMMDTQHLPGGTLPDDGIMTELRRIAKEANGEVVITDLIRDRGRPLLFVVQQIDADHFALGALGLDYIRKVQQSIAFGERGHSMIVDAKGTVMAHPNAEWERISRDASELSVVRRMMRGETGVATFYSPPMQAEMIAGHTVVPETGWGVMVPQPMSELARRAQDAQKIAIGITAISILIASIIGWWLAKYLSQPIVAVERAASAVATGRLHTQIEPLPRFSPVEMRSLATSFDRMVDELRHRDEGLRVAMDQAEAASRSKSEFLANMSHELRTPLNAILGFSEILERQSYGPLGSERYAEYAGDIHRSGEHLLDVINDVLDVSRIEAGTLRPEPGNVDLPEMVQACVNMTRNRAERSRIRVSTDIAADFPVLRADERMIRQIVLNLMSNALKFTTRGGRVALSAARDDDGGATIRVSDTGIGIAPEHIDLVVQPFQQVDNSLQRRHEGTGLGLFLCKTMAELQGATLSIESALGKGTTVTMRFPPSAVVERASADS